MSQNELLNLVEENAALVLLRNVRRKGSTTTLLSKVGGEDPIVHKHSCSGVQTLPVLGRATQSYSCAHLYLS